MSGEEYFAWQGFYRTVFCIQASPTDGAMFSHWGEVLGVFDFAELRAATLEVASSPEPRASFRQNHLSMLKSAVLANRFKRQRAEQDELDRQYRDASSCPNECTGGLVFVPHPHCMVNDDWAYPYYSACVCCSCPRGSQRFNSRAEQDAEKNRRTGSWIDIRSYEAIYPEWRELVRKHNAKIMSEREGEYYAKRADATNPIDLSVVRDWVLKNSKRELA